MLARHFLKRASEELKTDAKRLTPPALEVFKGFAWPGNVRQMENVCRWLTVMAPGQDVHAADLPPELRQASAAPVRVAAPKNEAAPAPVIAAATASPEWDALLRAWAQAQLEAGRDDLLSEATPRFERTLIEAALAATEGQRQDAAKRLGWGRNTLTRKIKELGMPD